MFCKYCGAEIDDNSIYCSKCGQKLDENGGYADSFHDGSINLGPNVKGKNKIIAAILALVVGDFGIQHFYLGNNTAGILSCVFFWTGIPAIIGLVQGVLMLLESDEDFAKRIVD